MKNRFYSTTVSFLLALVASNYVNAQGPNPSYYYLSATDLPWAEFYIHQAGGSQTKIPFLPAINMENGGPTGIGQYTKDVDLDVPIVFVGNGIVEEGGWDSYQGQKLDYSKGDIDVSGKIVLLCYDFPDSVTQANNEKISIAQRVAEAANRNAAGVILFSHKKKYPFLRLRPVVDPDIGDIPVISITMESAKEILSSSYMYGGESIIDKWLETGTTSSMELLANAKLKIQGKFDRIDTKHFSISFRKEAIPVSQMEQLSEINEKSLEFLFDYFKEFDLQWEKLHIGYFAGYDSKTFYTRHWGHGLACPAGVFSVLRGDELNYSTAVHENMHILAFLNWKGSSSFMNEGIGRFAEAMATDKNKNHIKTLEYLKNEQLFPVKEMLTFHVGMPGLETEVGYPASGSFIGYLTDKYGFKSVTRALKLESRSDEEKLEKDTWIEVYGTSIQELDQDWRRWLLKSFN
ncbi:PA domain-containing protein [Bacteroidota bacterium]